MKRARENVPETYAPRKHFQNPETSSPSTPPPEGRDEETGIWDWSKFSEGKIKNYVLDLKGLEALQTMAATESDGEMEEQEDTPSEEAVARDLKAWEEEYIKSDILSDKLVETFQCASHSCGMDEINKWTKKMYEAECTEGRNTVPGNEGGPSQTKQPRLVDATDQTDDNNLRERDGNVAEIERENEQVLHGGQKRKYSIDCGQNSSTYDRNSDIILLLCENGAFTESEAIQVLTRTLQGIKFICSKQYTERIKNYIHIARILVFQESVKQRFERAKAAFEKQSIFTDEYLDNTYRILTDILKLNQIETK
ncbi:unnamed protein product [Parnassius apollo]|uniref:(apollo) hypothetical protein n=1 Tax=Parnassius apollo TaxID=110799 RepID=A0A8S3YFY9_PARAO|nr:unnamed protein product [Parnassius apollo]